MLEKRIVLERVLRAFDVDILERVGRQLVVHDVLWRHAEKTGAGDAEKAVDMCRVARADLERAVDVGDSVGVAVHKGVDRQIALIREASDESARRACRHAGHGNENATLYGGRAA